jgi:hypothetical protein
VSRRDTTLGGPEVVFGTGSHIEQQKLALPGADDPAVLLHLLFLDPVKRVDEALAEQLLERALAIWEKVWGSEHWTLTKLLETYAELLRKTNRAVEAAKLETRARAIETMHTPENAGR